MRFGAPGSAASVFGAGEAKESTKSKGERFFERLVSSSADTENVAENVEATDEADDAGTDAGNGMPPTERREERTSFLRAGSSRPRVSRATYRATFRAMWTTRRVGWRRRRRVPSWMRSAATPTRCPPRPDALLARPRVDRFAILERPVRPAVPRRVRAARPGGLRLVRGRWGDERGVENNCVTAVKLTGDANVPAGAASFRARVGPGDALDSSFSYPEELGVVTRFKGQGRVAKPGFAERNWVDGELLLLDGRGGQLTGGAELGFVWAVPGERRLLILFSSLELPETTSGSMVLD